MDSCKCKYQNNPVHCTGYNLNVDLSIDLDMNLDADLDKNFF